MVDAGVYNVKNIEFQGMVENINDLEELKQLLSKDELLKFEQMLQSKECLDAIIQVWEPWWKDTIGAEDNSTLISDSTCSNLNTIEDSRPIIVECVEFEPKIPALKLAILDFLLSYIVVIRTFNGDLTNYDSFKMFTQLSFVVSNEKFVYDGVKELLELMKIQILRHESKISEDCLEVFYRDLVQLLRNLEFVKMAISDIIHLCTRFKDIKEAFMLGKKMEYYLGLCHGFDEIQMDCQLYRDYFVQSSTDQVSQQKVKPMIQEI